MKKLISIIKDKETNTAASACIKTAKGVRPLLFYLLLILT